LAVAVRIDVERKGKEQDREAIEERARYGSK